MLDRVEHPQSGVGTVARHQHHLDPGAAQAGVEVQQFPDQREGIAGLENLFFVVDLIFTVGLHTFGQVNPVAFAEVEQRPR